MFAGVMPVRRTWRSDFDAAGIPRRDEAGRQADFHALRRTLATHLSRAGVMPRIAMEFMRHSDMRLTARTYTDAAALPIADMVERLPRFTAGHEAQGDA